MVVLDATVVNIALAAHLAQATTPRGAALVQADAAIHSYTTAFWWAAGIFLLGAALAALVLRPGIAQLDPEASGGVVR